MTGEVDVPASLLKLERMRVKSVCHFAALRELTDRVNDLRAWSNELRRRNRELERFVEPSAPQMHAPGTHTHYDQLEQNKRSIAAYDGMLNIAQVAYEAEQANADEARLYEATKQHLLGELIAWGIE